MKQLSTRDQMTHKLTTIGQRITFNNEQSPYRVVSTLLEKYPELMHKILKHQIVH